MNKDEIRQLIGGYATGSLTDDERRQLFEAALDDQELFDALQEEQALKELLDDPVSREQIRRAAAESLPRAAASRLRQPWIWAVGAMVAAAAVLLAVLVPWHPKHAETKQVAMVRQEAPAPAPQLPPQLPSIDTPSKQVEPSGKVQPSLKEAQPAPPRMMAKKAERRAAPTIADAPGPAAASALPPPTPEQAQSEKDKSAEKDLALAPPPPLAPRAVSPSPTPPAPEANGQLGGVRRPAAAFRSKAIGSTATGIAPQLAFRGTGGLSFARRLEDGSFVNVPSGTVFHAGETLRLTIVPRLSGPVVVSEWDADTSSWTRRFPREGETIEVRGLERYTVPIDIIVKPDERLRVTVASGSSEIPLEVH